MVEHTVRSAGADVVCSVCIANYNGLGVIDDCLQSVLAQQCDFAYEIIVHDDASTDGSVDYIASRYPQAHLIRGDRNVGYCISNNRMAARARGRFLLLLNNDAALFPDALQALHTETLRHPIPVILTLPQYEAASGQLIDRGLHLDPFLNPVPNLDATRAEVATVHGACLWVARDLWNDIGGFPEWFHMLAEDLYLCCAARLRGANVMVSPRSGYRHRIGHSLGGGKPQGAQLVTTFRRRALSERNKNLVMLLCYPAPLLLVQFPLHVVFLVIEGLVMAVAQRVPRVLTRIYLASITDLWRFRHLLLAHRRSMRQRRVAGWREFFAPFKVFPHKVRLLWRHGIPRLRQ
jgi:GT2 family glycosyltransferase